MHSGPNTGFVSRDQMRGHAFKLSDPKLKQLFYRWQQRNQYDFLFMTNDGKVIVKVCFTRPRVKYDNLTNSFILEPTALFNNCPEM